MNRQQLLDAYPLIRARSAEQAREQVGRVLSPHHLHVRAGGQHFEARHNQLRLGRVAINVLSYGAEVEIDPGERGDFYLLQLPLSGRARLRCDDQEAWVDPHRMGMLRPRARTRMVWSDDCSMVMLQVPRTLMRQAGAQTAPPNWSLTRSRADPAVAAWWQAVGDLTRNLHAHGAQWLRHAAACKTMEAFLVQGLDLLAEPATDPARPASPEPRHLRRALDYLHAHAHENLRPAEVARVACVGPRALEAAFRRHLDQTLSGYARGLRLDRAREALREAHAAGRATSVTDVALQLGFVHMGRFAAYYRQRFGCTPSEELRGR
ncbi:MAG: AraC family transcriptional regulator [Rhodoferax sp.]|nr:AraC family transcriptional regulator [Rhodoferax sp.]